MHHLHLKKIIEYSVGLLFIAFVLYLGNQIGYEPMIEFMKANLLLGILIYFIYSIISNVIVFLPLVPLWPIVAYLYGFNLTIVVTIIGTLIGASICFLLSKRFGKKFVVKIMGRHVFNEVEHLSHFDSIKSFALIRLLGNNYYDLISYIAGLSKITYQRYIAITTFATIVWTIFLFFLIDISGGIENTHSFLLLMTVYAIIVLFGTLVWEIYHRHRKLLQ